MYPNIDTAKLADAQEVANKLATLPEKALVYIAGYTEGARDAASNRTTDPAPQRT